jgi:hypothetical protein
VNLDYQSDKFTVKGNAAEEQFLVNSVLVNGLTGY